MDIGALRKQREKEEQDLMKVKSESGEEEEGYEDDFN
jgi:hypothetical protein